MMKRFIAVTVILIMLFSLSAPAYAAGNPACNGGGTTSNNQALYDDILSMILSQILNNKGCNIQLYPRPCNPSSPSVTTPGASPTPSVTIPGVNPTPTPTVPGESGTQSPGDKLEAYAAEVVNLVNAERRQAGISELSVDKNVQAAAQVRAREIVTKFSHTRPDGSSPFTSLKEQNVSYRGAGENIAMGQTSPQRVMEGWMNSQGHRENILNKSYTKIGVGCYEDSAGRLYWTQLFIY